MSGKKHHTTQAFYLSQFAGSNPPDLVWVYEKRPGIQPRSDKANRISAEAHYYSIQLDDGTWDASLDDWITGIEGKAVDGLRTLLTKKIPAGADRNHVAQWLGLTYTRTRGMRRIMAETMARVDQTEDYALAADEEKFAEWIAKQEAMLGAEFEEADKQRIRAEMLAPNASPIEITKARLLDIWDRMKRLVPVIQRLKWTVVEAAKDSYFVTSDVPLIVSNPTPTKAGERAFE